MKAYQTQNIRNVVLLGSTKSGKTTLSEAMLYEGKVIDRRGTVEAKNTVSDNAEIEQINQRSIYATPLYAEFMDTKFNIVDTPGADDFVGGAVSAFKVCDTGVLVVWLRKYHWLCRIVRFDIFLQAKKMCILVHIFVDIKMSLSVLV